MAALEKQDRMYKLVAVCVRNGLYPTHSWFVARVRKLAVELFSVSEKTAQGYVDELVTTWRSGGKWVYAVKINPYLNEDLLKKHYAAVGVTCN